MTKWIKQVRALPSDPSSNDFLKIEYIDVNLNNSRKLIANVTSLASTSKSTTEQTEDAIENMLRLRNIKSELSWLDDLVD
ncbi:CIC11C00000004653 [Sungouiella intermedia]|uniref:CIC11C00000004653 n=1 Tax=Sungouiella intermedia TaxID=45354 RepID=A0A1L0GM43_9ASCO|nr:CIC11C00000004653 [[Candida] intermedia]